jgi:hypothetical protein
MMRHEIIAAGLGAPPVLRLVAPRSGPQKLAPIRFFEIKKPPSAPATVVVTFVAYFKPYAGSCVNATSNFYTAHVTRSQALRALARWAEAPAAALPVIAASSTLIIDDAIFQKDLDSGDFELWNQIRSDLGLLPSPLQVHTAEAGYCRSEFQQHEGN